MLRTVRGSDQTPVGIERSGICPARLRSLVSGLISRPIYPTMCRSIEANRKMVGGLEDHVHRNPHGKTYDY